MAQIADQPIIVTRDGITRAFPAGTPDDEIIGAMDVAVSQARMGPAPSMGASRQAVAPQPLNLGIGEMARAALPSMAELGGAAAAIAMFGGRPGPGAAMAPAISRQVGAGMFGGGATRAGIETLRPFMTGEAPRPELVAPAMIYGGAMPITGLSRAGFLPGMAALGRESGLQATAGGLAGAAEELGRGGTMEQAGRAAIGPAVIGGVAGGTLGAIPVYGQQFLERAKALVDTTNKYIDAGIKQLTPQLVEPGRYGAEEARRLSRGLVDKEGKEVVDRRRSVYSQINDGLSNIVGVSPEGALIKSTIRERVMSVPEAQEALKNAVETTARSEAAAQQAKAALEKAETAYITTGKEEAKKAHDAVVLAAQKAQERNFQDKMRSLVATARLQAVDAISQGKAGLATPDARKDFVVNVVTPAMNAYDEFFETSYSIIPNTAGFNPKPIIAELERVRTAMGADKSQLLKLENSKLNDVLADLTGSGRGTEGVILNAAGKPIVSEALTLRQMRTIRDALYDAGKLGEMTTANRTKLKEFGHYVSKQIDEQAESVYGPVIGSHLKGLNKDYAHFKELQKIPNFEVLFATDATDPAVSQVVNALVTDGPNSQTYAGVISFIENLAAPKQGRQIIKGPLGPVIMPYSAVIEPEMAAAMKGHFNSLIHQNILQKAKNGAVIDHKILGGTLQKIANHKELPALLGFSKGEIDNLVSVLKDFPDDGNLPAETWTSYLTNPVVRKGIEESGSTFVQVLRRDMADAAVQSRMDRTVILESLGKVNAARREYDAAQTVAKNNGITEADFRKEYMRRLGDPRLKPFQPSAEGAINPESYSTLLKTLFDPAAGATTNRYVADVFGSLRTSKDLTDKALLQDLQAAYIRDYLNVFETEGARGVMGQAPSAKKLSEYFRPMGGTPAAREMDRARIVLEPDQMRALEGLAEVGTMVREAEKGLPGATGRPKEGITPEQRTLFGSMTGLVQRGLGGVYDAIKRGDYDSALAGLLNPKEYANKMYYKGEWLTLGGRALGSVPGRTAVEFQSNQGQPMNQQLQQRMQQAAPGVMQFLNRAPAPSR
jgi:hypothetical protein